MGKKVIAIFFVTLIFQAGLVIPKMKSTFSPHMFPPEEFWFCYNSSHLVAQRGGLLLAAGSLKRIEGSSKNISSIIRGGYSSGSLKIDFDMPWSKYTAILDHNLFFPPAMEVHQLFSTHSVLSSQVYLTPPEHPS
jgi:hypothetical protein